MSTIVDITERKQSEAQLAKVQTQLVDAIESLTAAFAYYDAEDRLVLYNSKFRQLYDSSAYHIIPGVRYEDLIRTSSYRGQIAEAIGREEDWVRERLEQHQHPQEQPFLQQLGNGSWLQVSERRTTDGGIVVVYTDVTELIRGREALQESEARYRALVEQSLVGVYILQDEHYCYVNPRFAEMFGYTPEEIITTPRSCLNLVAEEDRTQEEENIQKRLQGNRESSHYIFRGQRKDRTQITVELYGTYMILNGKPAAIGTVFDISERKKAEEELRESERFFDNIFEFSPVGIGIADLEGNIIRLNQKFIDLFGYTVEDILTVFDWFMKAFPDKEYRDAEEANWNDDVIISFEPEAPVREYEVICKDGMVKNVEIAKNFGGNHYLNTFVDVTERKESERRLQISRDRYRLVTNNLPVIITYIDSDLTFQFSNKTFEDWFGISPVDKSVETILGEHALQVIKPYMERVLSGEYVTFDSIVPYKYGGARHVNVDYIPHVEDSGEVKGFFALIEDVTERKQLENQLRQAQKMEAIGTLAGGIAHGFNNILGAIFGYTELANYNLPRDHPSRNHLQKVMTAGHRAKDLVQQILTFSRQTENTLQPIQLSHIVLETLQLLRASIPTTIEIRSSLLVNVDTDTILADASQMHQIMLNLCTNAAHAMRDTGGILDICLDTVELDAEFATVHPELHPGPHVHLTIRDTGHGMNSEVLGRIFDPFFTTKVVGEGTGMGLSVVHGLIASHNGVITVQSTPGAGTTFELYLPRIAQTRTLDRADRPEEPLPHGTGRILFVDDEEALVFVGQVMLERLGYEVVPRTSSIEALETFRAMPQRFDLVITDQTMPNMTGEEFVQKLQRIRPDIPIILCTGFSHVMNAAKAQAMGIDAFLMKPVAPRDLAVTIQQVLGGQDAAPETQPGGRILLIDDDDQLRLMLRQVLETAGYEVIDASNGREGMQRYRDAPTDLVITDLIMPEQEGLETIQELRRNFPETKLIAISGGAREGTMDFLPIAEQLGANRILHKPFTPENFLEIIKEVLQ